MSHSRLPIPARNRSKPSISNTASRCCGPITACREPTAPRFRRTSRSRRRDSSFEGFHKDVDSYSAFTEADGKTTTGLAACLKARKLQRLFVAGLATDFCVAWTALDARKAGFETYVVEDACRGIDTQGSLAKAWADMAKAGVNRIQSAISRSDLARTASAS